MDQQIISLLSAELCRNHSNLHELLTRYVKLRFAHTPGMLGTFSPPLTSKEMAS